MKMNEKLVTIKAALAAFCTAVGAFLGWKGVMALVWLTAMALDYISGTLAACKAGDWCSATARQGLWHKGGMILVVLTSAIADLVMGVVCQHMPIGMEWPCLILPLVLAWYIITELGSILENAVKLGANVPGWLVKLLKAGVKAVEQIGESAVTEE
jgi:toxin secretion/phage lysis holin